MRLPSSCHSRGDSVGTADNSAVVCAQHDLVLLEALPRAPRTLDYGPVTGINSPPMYA